MAGGSAEGSEGIFNGVYQKLDKMVKIELFFFSIMQTVYIFAREEPEKN